MWTFVEAASALSIKVRTGAITDEEQAGAMRALRALEQHHVALKTVSEAHLRAAFDYTARPNLRLRGGDALHIAIAEAEGAMLMTADAGLARAASELNVTPRLLA
jgi:uncharacterized protein